MFGHAQLAARLEQAYKRSGYKGYLQATLEQSRQAHAISFFDTGYDYALLGDKEHTLEWLQKAYEARDPWLYLKPDPRFDFLHSDVRFQSLIRQMGLPL